MSRKSSLRFRPMFEALESREVPAAMALGMNLERVTNSMAAWMFTDAFQESQPWVSQQLNTATGQIALGGTVHVDSLGWPTQLDVTTNSQGQTLRQALSTSMFTNVSGHFPAGTYTAQWDGTGQVDWNGDLNVTGTGTTADGHHFALLNVTPGSAGIGMRVSTLSTADPIRNIHVWLPDYNGQHFAGQVWQPGSTVSPFHPLFLERLAPFHTLRFMDAAFTSTSDVQHWSDRRPWNYATQVTAATGFQNGLAPEYMVELCNELNADLWINIPHQADDTYIVSLAQQIQSTLNPRLKVYLEWSNEVMNQAPDYHAYPWIQQQLALPQNAGLDFYQFVAQQDRRVFDAWSQVFQGHSERLVRVVGAFESSSSYVSSILQYMDGDFDAIAPGAYFGPTPAMTVNYTGGTTVDQIVSDTQASIPTWVSAIAGQKALADQYTASLGRTIQLVAYEGGPNLQVRNASYQAAAWAAAADPRMYDIFTSFLNQINQLGMTTFMNYQYTGGLFGSLRYMDQATSDAARYRALIDYLAANPSTTPPAPTSTATPLTGGTTTGATGASTTTAKVTTPAKSHSPQRNAGRLSRMHGKSPVRRRGPLGTEAADIDSIGCENRLNHG